MLGILIAALMIGVLIFVHEFGHYAMARLLKAPVKELAIGFGKQLWGYISRRSGIAYTVRLLPFGGYTEFLTQEDIDGNSAACTLPFEEQAVWKRMLIILAGPAANMLLALALCLGLWYAEEVVTHYSASAEAYGRPYASQSGVAMEEPFACEEPAAGSGSGNIFLIGVANFGGAMAYAVESPGNALETIGGWLTSIIAIGDIVMEDGAYGVLLLMIFCSISMGLFNLIPIPGLDGGQLLMMTLEMVRGRKLSARWQNIYEWVCLGAIGVLFLCMGFNDVKTLVKLIFPSA